MVVQRVNASNLAVQSDFIVLIAKFDKLYINNECPVFKTGVS